MLKGPNVSRQLFLLEQKGVQTAENVFLAYLTQPRMCQDYLIDLTEWDEMPPCFNPQTHWLIDQCVRRQNLGLGVREVEFVVSYNKKSQKGTPTPADPPAPAISFEPTSPAVVGVAPAASSSSAPEVKPALPPPRLLARSFSSEEDEVELIAAKCKTCFSESLLWSEDTRIVAFSCA